MAGSGGTLSEAEVVAIAKAAALAEGWAWVEPALATFRRRWFKSSGKWEIFSNANGLGAKARFVIDSESGAILEKGYIPR